MGAEERRKLRRQFRYRCGYCGVRERDVGAELTVDHFQPRSKGGLDEPENWVYCCHACNEFKGDFWQPDSSLRLLRPLHDRMATHIAQDAEGKLQGLTETGTFHIERLHLNRPPLVENRLRNRRSHAVRLDQAGRIERIKELEREIQALTDEANGDEQGV